jgi:hypothetical protein
MEFPDFPGPKTTWSILFFVVPTGAAFFAAQWEINAAAICLVLSRMNRFAIIPRMRSGMTEKAPEPAQESQASK